MKTMKALGAACILALSASVALAADQAANKELITIPKEEYQKLLSEHQKLLDEMKEMKAFKAKFEESPKSASSHQTETDQALDDLEKRVNEAKQMAKDSFPGTTKLLLAGYGSAGFTAQDHGGGNQFAATFNPIFLWKLSDRLLFEGELEAELESHDTSLALEMAQISYVANDYMTIGAGNF